MCVVVGEYQKPFLKPITTRAIPAALNKSAKVMLFN